MGGSVAAREDSLMEYHSFLSLPVSVQTEYKEVGQK